MIYSIEHVGEKVKRRNRGEKWLSREKDSKEGRETNKRKTPDVCIPLMHYRTAAAKMCRHFPHRVRLLSTTGFWDSPL